MNYKQLCDVYEQLEATSKRLEKTALLADFLKSVSFVGIWGGGVVL